MIPFKRIAFKRVRIIVMFAVAVLIGVTAWFGTDLPWLLRGYKLAGDHRAISIGTSTVFVVTVTDDHDRQKGLSGTDGLAPDEGMLFVFPKEGHYAFWMKDMNYSIDIVWLNDAGTVVGMWDDAKPESYPRAYAPRPPARYVLELPAGYAKGHELSIGDTLDLEP